MLFWSFSTKYWHFLPISSHARPKINANKVLGGFSAMRVTTLYRSPVKIRTFCPRMTKFGPKLAFLPSLAGSFGALLVGWLVVVARRLYCARHLFTLEYVYKIWAYPKPLTPLSSKSEIPWFPTCLPCTIFKLLKNVLHSSFSDRHTYMWN